MKFLAELIFANWVLGHDNRMQYEINAVGYYFDLYASSERQL